VGLLGGKRQSLLEDVAQALEDAQLQMDNEVCGSSACCCPLLDFQYLTLSPCCGSSWVGESQYLIPEETCGYCGRSDPGVPGLLDCQAWWVLFYMAYKKAFLLCSNSFRGNEGGRLSSSGSAYGVRAGVMLNCTVSARPAQVWGCRFWWRRGCQTETGPRSQQQPPGALQGAQPWGPRWRTGWAFRWRSARALRGPLTVYSALDGEGPGLSNGGTGRREASGEEIRQCVCSPMT